MSETPNLLRVAKRQIREPDSYMRMVSQISAAEPGATIVYSTDEFARDDGVWRAAREAEEAGLVTLHARRTNGRLERIAVRR